jgi:translation elongation factor EF-1beta
MTAEGSSSDDLARQLQDLGDPSGRQDSSFWNDWFQLVCDAQDHRPFEWYCDVDEVLRVVEFHIQNSRSDVLEMIHPGSGTSLVPFKLLEQYPNSRQVIVDVSNVAIEEIKKVHAAHLSRGNNDDDCPIQYVLADLLDRSNVQSESFSNAAFDCWIDKGFVDAIFAKDENENNVQSASLFQKCLRILKSDDTAIGCAVIVSLAEYHSLQIIVENWLASCICNSAVDLAWQPIIHVWELHPISGNKPPVAIVLTKASSKQTTTYSDDNEKVQEICVDFVWHPRHGKVDKQDLKSSLVLSTIARRVEQARSQFISSTRKKSEEASQKLLATLEIKPTGLDLDLPTLAQKICHEDWKAEGGRTLNPQWQLFHDSSDDGSTYRVVPVAFGIFKLVMKCLIASDDLDEIVTALENWRVDDEDEQIQSVDIDWDNTLMVRNVKELFNIADTS